ncbi:MAG: hypothetical protein P8L24_01210 [Cytophagales bacterium]|nr:hypothetical protein [Cytophagales bacterium]
MKYLVNYILIFVLVSGCVNNTATIETNSEFDAGMAMFEKNKAIADKTFNLFVAKDLEGMMDVYMEDLIWSPANTTDSLSKDAFREGMMGWMSEFDQFEFVDRQYYPGVGDNFVPDGSVRTYGTWLGTHKSGKQTVTKYYCVLQFNEDGKITADLEWFDFGGVFDQLED